MLLRPLPVPDYYSILVAIQTAATPAVASGGPNIGPLPLLAQSIQAWAGFLLAVVALAMVVWRSARFQTRLEAQDEAQRTALVVHAAAVETRLNGFGDRVKRIEDEETARRERDHAFLVAVSECTSAVRSLTENLGDVRRSAAACDERTENFAITIGSKIDTMVREVRTEIETVKSTLNTDARQTGERLAGMERQLQMMLPYMPPPRQRLRDEEMR